MNIAIDFDDTYTADEILFAGWIRLAQERGHDVRFVTARHEWHDGSNNDIERAAEMLGIKAVFTKHQPKRQFCRDIAGWNPDVWLDDMPEMIGSDGLI